MASGRKPKSGETEAAARSPEGIDPHSKDRTMGSALRSVYQATVDESVPDDLLDLLGKLS